MTTPHTSGAHPGTSKPVARWAAGCQTARGENRHSLRCPPAGAYPISGANRITLACPLREGHAEWALRMLHAENDLAAF